jgi:glycosyltransferase involved in cell wall biosynthesis
MRLVRVAVNVEQLLYRPPGGIGRYTAKLVTLLPRLFADDEVVAFTAWHRRDAIGRAWPPDGMTEPRSAPIRLPLPRPALYEAWNTVGQPRLDWLSGDLHRVDLVHAPSVAVPPRGRVPLVVTIHDVAPALFPEAFPPHGRWFHARGLAAAARRADLVITVSQAARAEVLAHTTIAADRLRVVPNGVDHVEVTPAEIAATLTRHDLVGAPYVLWVGTLEPRKNVATLVEAMARLELPPGDAGPRLVLAGPSGWLSDDLLPARVMSRLGERVRFVGLMPEHELRALYAGAAVFALPSRHEGFGLPVLEAMAQATAVVCADIPALRELAGGAARLVPPDDVDAWAQALQEVLGDAGRRAALAAAGAARAGEFSWDRTVRETRAVYVEALRDAR